ncbi:DUF5412 family protein [Bacillus stercoris]|uniref:DUF5412 family protein n=3 Tax=Bacillus stercoris TaxID=2054641 RepID=UPI002DBB0EBF|nr:DUF5412 family protein [Bacillus stercoris]
MTIRFLHFLSPLTLIGFISSYHCFIELILKKCKDHMNPIYGKMREKKGESHIKTRSKVPLMFMLLVFFGGAVYWMLFSLKNVPKGNLVQSVESPDGSYTLNTYVSENTLSLDAARGELVNEKTLVKRTIYWNYPDSRPAVTWINHNTVKIGNQTLHLDTDETYDWRKDDHWIREEPPQAQVR